MHIYLITETADTTVTMSHVRSSTTTEIIKGANVPVNDAFVPMDGKLVLETNDSIQISGWCKFNFEMHLEYSRNRNVNPCHT